MVQVAEVFVAGLDPHPHSPEFDEVTPSFVSLMLCDHS